LVSNALIAPGVNEAPAMSGVLEWEFLMEFLIRRSAMVLRLTGFAATLAAIAVMGGSSIRTAPDQNTEHRVTDSATARTHLGQSSGSHVVLEVAGGVLSGCGPEFLDFYRVLPDGNREGSPGGTGWRIPTGKVLVITDVDWQYIHPDAKPGQIQVLRLNIENLADDFIQSRAFESTVVLSNIAEGGASESMTSGFVVSSKARICPDVTPGPQGPPYGLQHLILRGYLTNDK